ncbi:MAG: beta-lactamase family protein, partial [Candidatus Solibacter usitatus]|nr:beta-lactamase family protein [Candidatus Solibacter usitatus]
MCARPLFSTLLLAAWAWAGSLPAGKPEEVGLSSQRLARIRPAIQRYLDRNEIAGAVTLVARRGRIAHLETHGVIDLESKRPVEPDTLFRIASMTKPITSVAVMMLYEEGRFQLLDPVSKFIPEFKNPRVAVVSQPHELTEAAFRTVPAEREITIRDLLAHTAGLANNYNGPTIELYKKLALERKPEDSIGDAMKRLAKLPLNFQPGTAWS